MIEPAPKPLPSGRRGLDPEEVSRSQRQRLVDAMLWLSTEHGYEQVTIGDVTAHARTAKRTFYAHFPDREACYLAAYERVDAAAFEALARGAATQIEPLARIEAALAELLGYLAGHPREARLWVIDSRSAGRGPAEARVQTTHRLADLYLALVRGGPVTVQN